MMPGCHLSFHHNLGVVIPGCVMQACNLGSITNSVQYSGNQIPFKVQLNWSSDALTRSSVSSVPRWNCLYFYPSHSWGWPHNVWASIRALESRAKRREGTAQRNLDVGRYVLFLFSSYSPPTVSTSLLFYSIPVTLSYVSRFGFDRLGCWVNCFGELGSLGASGLPYSPYRRNRQIPSWSLSFQI